MEFRHITEKPLFYSILLNGLIAIAELIGGLFSGSLALISDAMHNFSDFIALIITFIANRIMYWSGNTKKSYGYFRFEILAAFVNSVLLVLIGAYIIYEALARFSHPVRINSILMLIIAAIGFTANLFSVLLLRRHRKENLNIQSAFLHLITDTLESAAVIITAIIITVINFSSLDLIISIIIGVFIIKSSWDLLVESTNILTEGSPKGIDLNEVGNFIKNFPGIKGVHHLHIWSLSSNFRALSAHIVVDDMRLSRTVTITGELEQQLATRFSIDHPTFQLEADACEEDLIAQYRDRNRKLEK
ncbi:MAG: cation diffusion facilitator family transporter [Candidatus Kryptoniota bacterium]